MTKQHKSTGNLRSTSLKDPRLPDPSPATSLADKKEALIFKLLTNHAEAGDIPLDVPTTVVRSIFFPSVSQPEIQKAILKNGNKSPVNDEIPIAILYLAQPLIENHIS